MDDWYVAIYRKGGGSTITEIGPERSAKDYAKTMSTFINVRETACYQLVAGTPTNKINYYKGEEIPW